MNFDKLLYDFWCIENISIMYILKVIETERLGYNVLKFDAANKERYNTPCLSNLNLS